MNGNVVKGYVLSILSGLVIIAAVVLVILQWGNVAGFSLYGKNIPDLNTALLVIASAVGGIVLLYLARLLLYGLRALRTGHRQQEAKSTEDRLRRLEQERQSAPRQAPSAGGGAAAGSGDGTPLAPP